MTHQEWIDQAASLPNPTKDAAQRELAFVLGVMKISIAVITIYHVVCYLLA